YDARVAAGPKHVRPTAPHWAVVGGVSDELTCTKSETVGGTASVGDGAGAFVNARGAASASESPAPHAIRRLPLRPSMSPPIDGSQRLSILGMTISAHDTMWNVQARSEFAVCVRAIASSVDARRPQHEDLES